MSLLEDLCDVQVEIAPRLRDVAQCIAQGEPEPDFDPIDVDLTGRHAELAEHPAALIAEMIAREGRKAKVRVVTREDTTLLSDYGNSDALRSAVVHIAEGETPATREPAEFSDWLTRYAKSQGF